MGSKGRLPPHIRRPHPGPPGMMHPDPFGAAVRPPPGAFPFDMLPPPEVLEQKLANQHIEMERLATENQRLAATHSTLRQELAASQQELQRLQAHLSALKAEQEQQLRVLLEKNAKMEAELQASEPLKVDLQQAHSEAQNLITSRQELILKVQKLTQDLQMSHGDVQQIPALMSELDALRQEYENCRTTYEYERKIFTDHYESLQVMEKNYVSMVREVEKLRAELANSASLARGSGSSSYGANAGYKENDASIHHSVGQTAYEDGYGVSQYRGPSASGTASSYGGGSLGPAPARGGHDAIRGPSYDAFRNTNFDMIRGTGVFEPSRVSGGYDASMAAGYEVPRAATIDAQRGGSGYDVMKGALGAAPATVAPGNSATPFGTILAPNPYLSAQVPNPYGSGQTPTHALGGLSTAYGSGQGPTHSTGGFEMPRGSSIARR